MTQRAGLGTDNPQSTASLNENVSGTESQTSSPSPPSTARQPIVLPSSQDNLSARDKPLDVVDISQSSPSPSTTRQSFTLPSSQDNLPTRDSILQNHDSSDPEKPLDVVNISQSKPGRRCRKSYKNSTKKDRCPCQLSDTSSWKPKCSKCNQTWHSSCCNLKGISSILELEDWECPWCYVPLFGDPSKPKAVSNMLKEIRVDIDSINHKCDNFKFDEINSQISELKQCLNLISVPSATPTVENNLHNELVNSVSFELQKMIDNQNSFVTQELTKLKKSLNQDISVDQPVSINDNDSNSPVFTVKHFDHHKSNFLEENIKDSLKQYVTGTDIEFKKVGNRDVLYFGDFSYKYSNIEHSACPMPNAIHQVIEKIHEQFPSEAKINSCLITKYTDGSSICPPHSDNEPFINPSSDIFTLSMGAERTMKFDSITKHTCKVDDSILLKDNDLHVFSRVSQDFYHHSIVSDESATGVRYSFTFRCLAPYNLNYTKIIGDSNTQELVFGPDRGKLGQWLPGALMKASKIANIPDPFSIGPCRNAVIHVGLNDVQAHNPKSAQFLSNLLESKIKSILSVYPKKKIFLSLLLPTKDTKLNFRVNELNYCLKQLAANHGNVDVIEHFNLVDVNGFLDPNLGRFKRGLPNINDQIHLGINGIKRFVLNIKNKIMHKKSLNGTTQPSHSRASQFPLPTSTAPWQQWSSGRTPTASPTHPSGNPSLLSNPNPIPFSAPTSGIGSHQHSSTMYQALFPSISADGYQY